MTTQYTKFKKYEERIESMHFSVDSLERRVYWTVLSEQTIVRSNIEDGSRTETVMTSERALYIYVLEETREMYWLSDKGTEKHLKKAFLDGSSPSTLSIDPTNDWECFAMDGHRRKVYLGGSEKIVQIDVSGQTIQSKIFLNNTQASFLYFHKRERRLYWPNNRLVAVQHTNLDTPAIRTIPIRGRSGKIPSLATIQSTIYIILDGTPTGLLDLSTYKAAFSVRLRSAYTSASAGVPLTIFITDID
ncbi:uncharacterized protein LOC121417137 [Lytechinus variegatus]|uniref:uncharacterized protein LOC121417137 n=1 Tax=Lytechinus variegatus TaxID=7654 RepID=UPI001BB2C28D|nr:uncharacterized protein LOC121417137 [Lytechinus variegatus]